MQQNELMNQTRSHYDDYPFIEGGSQRVAWWREYLLDFFPDADIEGCLMVDVGSSVGEISRGLADRGARMVCVDLSLQSLRRCREINPEAEVLHCSALELPFPGASFDNTISIGVLHHTPDCRGGFAELARVTAPGGTIVVFLYNYWNIYNLIFQLFKPVRWTIPLERVPVWVVRLLQPFARSHLGQSLDDEQLRRLLGDKLWTPQATFHSVREVRRWGEEEGLAWRGRKRFYLGYANVMCFTKAGPRAAGVQRELRLRCTECGSPMIRGNDGHRCDKCPFTYPVDGGIVCCIPQQEGKEASF